MTANLPFPKAIEDALPGRRSAASRRTFLKTSGALVVSYTVSTLTSATAMGAAADDPQAARSYPDPDFRQLDTWIVIHPDNTATFYVGKTDGGQGTGTAFRQMMSDELDMAYDKTNLVMGSTDITPDQGGSGGSDALERDSWPARRVAAEARRVLIDLAAKHFGVQSALLAVSEGKITVKSAPSKSITYAKLISGRRFNVTLDGSNVNATTGIAPLKPVSDLRSVGQSIQRYDIPAKVDGSLTWAVDMKVPDMVHARNVRPPFVGATLQSVDESSIADVPGLLRVVVKGNYVAVVCEREENAIRAAQQLRTEWTRPEVAPFPASDDLFNYMRAAKPTASDEPRLTGDPDAAFATAAQVLDAEYEIPFQGHTAIGPAHALADPSGGQMTIYSNDMKTYGLRNGVAEFLDMPREQVRVVYMDGPQVYGRTAADDAGFEAAFLARELNRPVRMQWSREEETAWDTKGPAYTIKLSGGLDDSGNVVALDCDARALAHNHLGYNGPDTVLMAQLMGRRPETPNRGFVSAPSSRYAVANQRTTTHVVSLPTIWETPLRTGNLRDPNGPQVTFAYESFIDELAAAAAADPVAFRLKLLADSPEDDAHMRARSIAVIRAAAEAYGWSARPAPALQNSSRTSNEILTGRGFAYTYRNLTTVAEIAEVEVNRRTGRVWVKRLVCAHDCGLVVNPEGLKRTIECSMLHALSRALWEEVEFDTEAVTSIDWFSHPTLRHSDTPETIDVVLVNGDPDPDRPDLPPYGAGEPSHKPLIAAVANAIYDATGVRLRRAPFREERVLRALQQAGL
ncbi:MAG: molybdopterin-dependent oxidoreductase [Rhodospirillaceae bacterium]